MESENYDLENKINLIYDYNYNMYLMEERVNMVVFIGGNAALMYAT